MPNANQRYNSNLSKLILAARYTVQETILQLIFDDNEIIYVMTLLYIMCICQKNTNLLHLQMTKIAYFIFFA
jgi:hypothetical protein